MILRDTVTKSKRRRMPLQRMIQHIQRGQFTHWREPCCPDTRNIYKNIVLCCCWSTAKTVITMNITMKITASADTPRNGVNASSQLRPPAMDMNSLRLWGDGCCNDWGPTKLSRVASACYLELSYHRFQVTIGQGSRHATTTTKSQRHVACCLVMVVVLVCSCAQRRWWWFGCWWGLLAVTCSYQDRVKLRAAVLTA